MTMALWFMIVILLCIFAIVGVLSSQVKELSKYVIQVNELYEQISKINRIHFGMIEYRIEELNNQIKRTKFELP